MRITPPRAGHVPTVPSASSSPGPEPSKRRRFLFALSAGSAVGAAAAVAGPAIAAPAAEATPAQGKRAGYRETEHVRDYYATTRL
jgi:hypothetical protein